MMLMIYIYICTTNNLRTFSSRILETTGEETATAGPTLERKTDLIFFSRYDHPNINHTGTADTYNDTNDIDIRVDMDDVYIYIYKCYRNPHSDYMHSSMVFQEHVNGLKRFVVNPNMGLLE
jgi:hypothetical protein